MRALEKNLLPPPRNVCESSQVSWRPHLIVIGRAENESTALEVAAACAGRGEIVRRPLAMGSPIDDSAADVLRRSAEKLRESRGPAAD